MKLTGQRRKIIENAATSGCEDCAHYLMMGALMVYDGNKPREVADAIARIIKELKGETE